jgi:hypothetical protein
MAEATPAAGRPPWGRRLKPIAFALIVPALLLMGWHAAVAAGMTRLIPSPAEVAEYMVDFAIGGIWDDAFSATLHIHLLASAQRVYGGFLLAALVAVPLGLLIGRVALVRDLLDPFLQLMRPIPVTAWLPLSMILFGLGPRSAFFLVFLGAFYPILLNTIFGVKNVEPRLFEAAAILPRGAAGGLALDLHRAAARARPRLVRHRCRRDDRRAPGARRRDHGWPHPVAHRAGDLRHDHHRHRRLPQRPGGGDGDEPPSVLEPVASWLRFQSSTSGAWARPTR